MNDHLKAAIDFSQNAADDFDRGRRVQGKDNIQLALAAAAIAQAEATEWQAQTQVRIALAAERQAAALERIVALLSGVIEPAIKDTDGYLRTGGV